MNKIILFIGISLTLFSCTHDYELDNNSETEQPSEVAVQSISINPASISLVLGETLQLSAIVLPYNATDRTVTWTSNNPDIVSVENGLVTALAIGEAYGCKSLKKAPALPALNLNYHCYENMFNSCSSLNYIKMMATKVYQNNYYVDITPNNIDDYCADWVNGVAASGTFVKNPDAQWDIMGPNGVPEGWTIEL